MSFSWTPFFEEMLSILCRDYNAAKLASLAHEVFQDAPLKDQFKDGTSGPITEFDPLTFIGYFNRSISNDRRIKNCQVIKEKLKLSASVPTDFKGIPTINNQASWFFPYAKFRQEDAFPKLWKFASALQDGSINDQIFADALGIKGVGLTKLTQICFICKPSRFLPLDKNTTEYLSKEGLDTPVSNAQSSESFSEYEKLLQEVKKKFPAKNMTEISASAYEDSDKPKYWLLGATWGDKDKSGDFIKLGTWENGYTEENDKGNSIGKAKLIKVGDLVAIKSGFVVEKKFSTTGIKAIGTVLETNGDGRSLKVKWTFIGPRFDIEGASYRQTVHEVTNTDDINLIFNGNFKSVRKSKNAFEDLLKTYDSKLAEVFISLIRETIQKFDLPPNDKRLVFATPKDRLTFTVCQRYCLSLHEEGEIGIITDKQIDDEEPFNGDPLAFYSRFDNSLEALKVKNSYFKAVEKELPRQNASNNLRHDNHEFRAYVFGVKNVENYGSIDMDKKIDLPLNLILYGPPGVGKTHQILKLREKFISSTNSDDSVKIFKWTSERSWWEVIIAAVIDLNGTVSVSEIEAHPFLKAKIQQSTTKTPRNTIWGMLQLHTISESTTVKFQKRAEPLVFDKTEDSKWFLTGDWKESLADLVNELNILKSKSPEATKRYEVVTFHQAYGYEDFIEGIRPVTSDESDSISYKIESGVFKRISERAKADPNNQYALFIDEINRGNIAKIFGELITLIEEDKRDGSSNATSTVLPYSKTEFSVPSNLYVIGTMNSVDRSIALLDMALRRRFKFQRIEPDSSLVVEKIDGINFRLIFEKLNERISVLLGEDYQLGHSYFLKHKITSSEELKSVWFDNILPLFQEYFFDDWDKLKALAEPFIESTEVKGLGNLGLLNSSRHRFCTRNLSTTEFTGRLKKLAETLGIE